MEQRSPDKFHREPELPNVTRIAFIGTILVHVLLAVLFFFINVGWQYQPSAWVEMDFIAVKSRPSRARKQPAQPMARKKPAVKASQQKLRIALPKRTLAEDDLQIIQRKRRDLPAQEETTTPVRATDDLRRRELDPLQQTNAATQKKAADLGILQTGEKKLDMKDVDLGKGVTVPFRIEGDVADRTVLYKVLPEYPGGLSREAVVKLRFSVLPTGVIVNIVPLQKGDAALERAAITAFQQWRFNPLTGQSDQHRQSGVITFRFVLR